ncbi:MAG: bifunctional DNA primase/polymerase [Bifidobacteriaceae bacterium]|jgi:hypothetical protein|nr:bifunctional DNA primase/polymerase [Bifidobacteriaceae bacterium]
MDWKAHDEHLAVVAARMSAIRRAQGWPTALAALTLARSGVPVFPCEPGGKKPLTRHGFLDASTDAGRVEAWWRRRPEANIGVPTGAVSGLDVVDVDVRGGGSGFDRFRQANAQGVGEDWAMAVRTPSGGMHYYYPSNPQAPRMSWARGSAHVDFRGAGGYIIVPPSQIEVDGTPVRYQVLRVLPHAMPVDAGRLRDLVDPEAARRRMATRVTPGRVAATAQDSALARWVSSRPEGERNTGLFFAACRLVEAGRPFDHTLAALAPAAQRAGLLDREITATVRSAYRRAHAASAPSAPVSPSRPGPATAAAVVL